MRLRAFPWGRAVALAFLVAAATSCGSSGSGTAATPPCDATCMDDVAITAFRDTLKLAFNLTLQGKPVGAQDATASCPLGGSVRVVGTATSNADQGTTDVNLTYTLSDCAYSQVDSDPTATYSMTVNGTATETGTLSAQPSSTTALTIDSTSMTLEGTVYAPPLPYDAEDCAVMLGQNGNELAGTLCGRSAGATL